MAINPDLLIQAAVLQDYIVDKTTGAPLSGGIITFYQDNQRNVLKNVYQQTGTAGNYTYLPLPNPLVLSGYGTFMDNNGNDITPYFYPYDENNEDVVQTYYVTVYSANQNGTPAVLQWTRQNFPLVPENQQPTAETSTNVNYVVNKEFWRNIGTSFNATNLPTDPITGQLSLTLCPSQHDGFSMPDMRFIKNANGANDTLNFYTFLGPNSAPLEFDDQSLDNDPQPEYYFNLDCTGAGTETEKFIQIPLSLHIRSMSALDVTFTIQAMNVGGSPNNVITLSVLQFLGTGLNSAPIQITSFTLGNTWSKFTFSFTLPSANNVVVGGGGDDALYLQIGFPVGVTSNINIAMPSLYIGDILPVNSLDTYDQVDAIVGTPRTGDIRQSLNSFYPYGWVPMNDGVLSNGQVGITLPSGVPSAYANVQAWPLYNLIWNRFKNTQSLAPLFASAGTPQAYGASAIADFNAGNQLSLTKMLGRVIAGVAPVVTYQQTFTVSGSTLTVASTSIFGSGVPVMVSVSTGGTLPTGLSANTVYYCINSSSTTLQLSATYAGAFAPIDPITLSSTGSGTLSIFIAIGAPLGSTGGTLTDPSQLAAHNHPGSFVFNVTSAATPGSSTVVGSSLPEVGEVPLNVSTQGSGGEFGITQPTNFMNFFMKL